MSQKGWNKTKRTAPQPTATVSGVPLPSSVLEFDEAVWDRLAKVFNRGFWFSLPLTTPCPSARRTIIALRYERQRLLYQRLYGVAAHF